MNYLGEEVICSKEEAALLDTKEEVKNFVNAFQSFKQSGLLDVWKNYRKEIFEGIGKSGALNAKISLKDGNYIDSTELHKVLRCIIYSLDNTNLIPQESSFQIVKSKIERMNRPPKIGENGQSNIGTEFKKKFIVEGNFQVEAFKKSILGFQ